MPVIMFTNCRAILPSIPIWRLSTVPLCQNHNLHLLYFHQFQTSCYWRACDFYLNVLFPASHSLLNIFSTRTANQHVKNTTWIFRFQDGHSNPTKNTAKITTEQFSRSVWTILYIHVHVLIIFNKSYARTYNTILHSSGQIKDIYKSGWGIK